MIPGGTFTAGDVVKFTAINTQDFTGGGWIYQGIWASPSTTIFSGTRIGGTESTAYQAQYYGKTFFIHTADGTGAGTAIHGAEQTSTDEGNDGIASYSDRAVTAINWNNDVYINMSCFVDNPGSSITNRGMNIVKLNA